MSDDRVIIVDHLYKKFCAGLKRSMIYGVQDIFRDWLGISTNRGVLRESEFWALEDVSFELKRGETIGIIGKNGAGKSTLLRLLNGIYPPDKGRIEVRGRIAALIALGAGFHPHLTGRENIFLSGTILGMRKKGIQSKLDAIIDFAGVGSFIDAPVSTYSSGMYVRLGFAIATHAPIEILLADEVLAVGDISFRIKCWNKIAELRQQGVSTLLVTHDMATLAGYADRTLLLNAGKSQYYGETTKAIEIYLREFMEGIESAGEIEKSANGTDEFIIDAVRFSPELRDNKIEMERGHDLTVSVDYDAKRDFEDINIYISAFLPFAITTPFYQTNSAFSPMKINLKKGKGTVGFTLRNINLNNFRMDLGFVIALENKTIIVLRWKRIPVFVHGDGSSAGIAYFDTEYFVR